MRSATANASTNNSEALVELLAERAIAGKTTFDCADIYTGVEELLGRVRLRILELGGEEPQIHTKCVPDLDRLATLRKEELEATIDRSLRRLGVERLDLVQFHWWDLDIPGYEQAGLWLDAMRQAGKIRHLGVTNFPTAALERLLDAGVPVVAHQVQYSLLDRRPAETMSALCEERGVSLLCYGSLAGGLLSSRFLRSGLSEHPRNRSEVKYRLMVEEAGGWSAVEGLLQGLQAIGALGSTGSEDELDIAQQELVAPLAVRWVLEQKAVAAAIVGASRDRDLALGSVLDLPPASRAALRSLELDSLTTIPGDVYELERDRESKHGSIMRYNLQTE